MPLQGNTPGNDIRAHLRHLVPSANCMPIALPGTGSASIAATRIYRRPMPQEERRP
jgi:hypothetical protein